MFFQAAAIAALLPLLAAAAPAKRQSGCPPPPYGSLDLPANFPPPSSNCSVPKHFSLHGWSYNGNYNNLSLYVHQTPHHNGYGTVTLDDGQYGSYAFGLGNGSHLFAHNDGDIAYVDHSFDAGYEMRIDFITFTTWRARAANLAASSPAGDAPIPTCSIVPYYNQLTCQLNGTALDFAYCPEVDPPDGLFYDRALVWGTEVENKACKKVAVRVEQVERAYGNPLVGVWCEQHPAGFGCPGADAAADA